MDSGWLPKLKEFNLNLSSESLELFSAVVRISSVSFKFWYLPQTEGVSLIVTIDTKKEKE